jgi:hypothetical protein
VLSAEPDTATTSSRGLLGTRNGETCHVLSPPYAGAGNQARCCDGVGPALNGVKGYPKQLMPGVMPRIG